MLSTIYRTFAFTGNCISSLTKPAIVAFAPWTLIVCASVKADSDPSNLIASYIAQWANFYPTEAYANGDVDRANSFERYTIATVDDWLAFNRETYKASEEYIASPTSSPAIDIHVLRAQIENELASWQEDDYLHQQPQWYAEQISQALTSLLVREGLQDQARSDALITRLNGVAQLAQDARANLRGANAARTETALRILTGVQSFYADGLKALVTDWPAPSSGTSLIKAIDDALDSITRLEVFVRQNILPLADTTVSIGQQAYTNKLSRRTAGAYSPQALRNAALQEVKTTRSLMDALAGTWYEQLDKTNKQHINAQNPGASTLDKALAAMENDRDNKSADFLASFRQLTAEAEQFVEAHDIASVPKPTTLYIALSPPHFSGAAVGGVYPSGPFDPSANTLFYVPSVSDDASSATRQGFYRSFNTHFNTMIMSHEMFPGHYLQYKVAVAEAPAVRSLYPNGSYVEGWGSFVEELMLDAGWADDAPLTRLAHLRKRLENATRAYVSVQVNTANWGEQEVLQFASEEGLLAPQFATNLWRRVINSPLQITDYMTGYLEFKRLYASYVNALRKDDTEHHAPKPFVDAVLRAGPIPLPYLAQELKVLTELPNQQDAK